MARGHRGTRARLGALLTVIGMLSLGLGVALPGRAGAAVVGTGTVGGFEQDGNQALDAAWPGDLDWANVTQVPVPDSSPDRGYTGGSKEEEPAGWTCVTGPVTPGKDDLLRADVNVRIDATQAYLDLSWIREAGNGDVDVLFEFNKLAGATMDDCQISRAVGDFIVDYEFRGQGAQVEADVILRQWNGTSWVDMTPSDPAAVKAATNTASFTDELGLGTIETREFGEVSIDLTKVTPPATECLSAGYVNVRSRPSRAVTSALKDFLPTAAVDISTCGSIVLEKKDDAGNALAGAIFGLYGTAAATGTPIDTCTSQADGTCSFEDVDPGTYWIKEIQAPANHDPDPDIVQVEVAFRETVNVTPAFVNPRHKGTLKVKKTTFGGTGTFHFDASCSDGQSASNVAVTTSGAGPAGAATATLISDIPVGSTCTVTEDEANQAPWTTTSPTAQPVTIVKGANLVEFENTLETGDLIVRKTTTGGTGTFEYTASCGEEDGVTDTITTTQAGQQTSKTFFTGLPIGTTCTVTEADPGVDWTTTPNSRTVGPITLVKGANYADFTNALQTADIYVNKTSTGGTGTFTFDVACGEGYTANDVVVDTATNNGADVLLISGVPISRTCTVTEDDPGAKWVVTPSNRTVILDGLSVGRNVATFTNAKVTRALTVEKVTTGGTGEFSFNATCGALTGTLTLDTAEANPDSGTIIEDVPVDTTCTVTESDPGAGWSTTPPSRQVVVTITLEGPNRASFSNAKLQSLIVRKTSVGNTGTFTFEVSCDNERTVSDLSITTTASGAPVDKVALANLPAGTVCTVVEDAPTGQFWTTTPADRTVRVTIAPTGDTVAAFVNSWNQPPPPPPPPPPGVGIDIVKSGPSLAHVGDTVTYTMRVTNTGQTPLVTVAVSDPRCDTGTLQRTDDGDGDSVLAVGEEWRYRCTRMVQSTDPDPLPNTSTVNGSDSSNRTVTDTDDHVVDIIHPAIEIVKTVDDTTPDIGQTVTFSYVVTNTGDAALSNVTVTDDQLGAIGTVASLAPGESVTLTKTMVVATDSPTTNIGTSVGTDVLGEQVSDTDDEVITLVLPEVVVPTTVQPPTTTQKPAEVKGVQFLPRTGAGTNPWLLMSGLALSLGGLLLLVGDRRRPATDR